jgi:hypothetical protein
MATRPTVSIEWGTGSIPAGPTYTLTQQQNGYAVGQQPTAQGDNGWQNGVYQWQKYFDSNLTTTATAAGTTTLTVASDDNQLFTGSTIQDVVLPNETTLAVGRCFHIYNNSSGIVTVKDSGGSAVGSLKPQSRNTVTGATFCSTSAGAATGNWIFLPVVDPGQIPGTTTNDSAGVGFVGEAVRSDVVTGSAVSLTTSVFTDITNISLTAGDWDISFVAGFTGTPTGLTDINAFIGTASGNNTTGRNLGDNAVGGPLAPTSVSDVNWSLANYRVSIAATTSYFLKARAIFTGSTCSGYGRISARRIR